MNECTQGFYVKSVKTYQIKIEIRVEHNTMFNKFTQSARIVSNLYSNTEHMQWMILTNI